MKLWTRLMALVAVLAVSSGAFAWGLSISGWLGDAVADTLPVEELGDTLYDTQEDVVHGTLTNLTGISVDHYYIDVCTGDECLPLDPFRLSN